MKKKKEVKGDVDRLYDTVCRLQVKVEKDRLQEVVNNTVDSLRDLEISIKSGMISGLGEVTERLGHILIVLDTFATPEIVIFMPPRKEVEKHFSKKIVGGLKESAARF